MTKEKTNDQIWKEIKGHEDAILALKKQLKKATLPEQASLHKCNELARKAKTKPVKVDPKRLTEESSIKAKVIQ